MLACGRADGTKIAIKDVEDRLLQHAQTDSILSRIVTYVPHSHVVARSPTL